MDTASRADLSAALGMDTASRADLSAALGMDTASRVKGRLFALAPRLVEILDLGAREYGMS